VAVAVTPPKFAAPAMPKPVAVKHAPAKESTPLVVKMLTPDPDVVIYWLIDAKEGP
jgi:hypothetical protein